MRLVGSFAVSAAVERVWAIFQDPDTLCALATSCESARQVDEARYEGVIRVRVALVSARAHIVGTVVHREPPNYIRVAIAGRTTGIPGGFNGVAQLWLTPLGDTTMGEYVVELDLLGRLDALGQPLFQAAAQRLATTFAGKVSHHLQATAPPADELPRQPAEAPHRSPHEVEVEPE